MDQEVTAADMKARLRDAVAFGYMPAATRQVLDDAFGFIETQETALAIARAEAEAKDALLRECQGKLGDIVIGEGLHPDDAAALHAKIAAALGGTQ